jgi:hypothetical protein
VKAEIHFDVDRLQKAFNLTERQLSFAAERALNDTAFKAREDWGIYIRQKVDRPVPMTVKSALVKKARRANLVATVFLRNEASKGTPPDKYLAPLLKGGPRTHKRFEKALIRAGVMAESEYAIPAAGARLNRYGNMTAGQITQILSGVRANPDPLQNKRKGSRSQWTHRYFVVRGRAGKLVRGVWMRKGASVVPVLIFTTNRPSYKFTLSLEDVVWRTATRDFPRFFRMAAQREIDRALATVK